MCRSQELSPKETSPSLLLHSEPVLKAQNSIYSTKRTDDWGYKHHKVTPGQMVLEKQRLVLPLLHENKQPCSHLVKVFCPVVISKERSRTICSSEPKVTMAILSALVAVPFRPSRESISAAQDWPRSLFLSFC